MSAMKFDLVIFIFISFASKSASGFRDAKVSTVNAILHELSLEQWEPEESSCRRATQDILNGVKNNTLWATWVWDSMQLPVGTLYGTLYHLGNFDQCLKVPWPSHQNLQTQYCLVDVKLAGSSKYDKRLVDPYDDAVGYIGAEFRRKNLPNTLFLGVCLPASCSPGSIAKISRHIFSLSHLPFEDVVVDPRDCQTIQSIFSVEKPIGFYVFWCIILAMVSICVLVYFFGNNTRKKCDSTVSMVTRCFCLTRNFDALTEVHKDDIKMVTGMRALTCGMLIVGHLLFLSQTTFVNQMDAENELTTNPVSKLVLHLDLCVDTFILMSGLFYFRGLVSSKSYQPYRMLFKRYLRLLLPLYALFIFCMSYVLPYVGSGPVWPRMVRKTFEPCARSWWRNLLMITNKVDDLSICGETTWHVICDFQLSVLATVIFSIYRKSERIGILTGSLVYVLSVTWAAVCNYRQELPGILWYDFGESPNSATNKVYESIYRRSYIRPSTYLIGVAMGYLMTVYKPHYYRKTLSKGMSILAFVIGMNILVSTLLIGVKMHKREFSMLATALIAAFDKSLWSIGICIIIVVCEYGTLPIVTDFLGSKLFVPLSKLTFSVYLFHIIFLYRDRFSIRVVTKYDTVELITAGLGYVVISGSLCFLIWLFIEAPVTNLINILFNLNRRPDTRSNVDKEAGYSNGVTKIEKVS